MFKCLTLSFGRLRQRMLPKCVQHVQHDYISSFNQSDHVFFSFFFFIAVAVGFSAKSEGRRIVGPIIQMNSKLTIV